jgi:putative RecB family exonuclease
MAPHSLPTSFSASRANDFMQCALLYRFRVIDRLPEPPSVAAVRGTLVHSVLERLFGAPAAHRTLELALAAAPIKWKAMRESDPALDDLLAAEGISEHQWMEAVAPLLQAYFSLEDPTRFEPASLEQLVEWRASEDLLLRGYIDRVDRSPAGDLRVVDYKTGKSPREGFEGKAMFQMRFYGLLLWRTTGQVPRLLQLLYLGNGQTLSYAPDESDLLATERKVTALWQAITDSVARQEFRPNPSALCSWCSHKPLCPAFGGQAPPFPTQVTALDDVPILSED